jgi:uncharacterized coiled-coil DUF342 family protein
MRGRGQLIIENRAQPRDDGGADIPQTWESAYALMAEVVAERFAYADRCRAEDLQAFNRQIEDLSAQARRLTDLRAEDLQARQAAEKRADDLARQAVDLQARLDDQAGQILALNKSLDAVQQRADDLQEMLNDAGAQYQRDEERRAADDRKTGEAIADARGVAAAAVKGTEKLQETAAQLSRQVGELEAGAVTRAQLDEIGERMTALGQDVRKAAATAGEMVDEIVKAVDQSSGAVNQVATLTARASHLLDRVPAGFDINQAGELTRISATGEIVAIGRVVGRDGRDGVDGKDGQNGAPAPRIIAAAIEANSLRIIQSDGIEHRCEFHVPAPVAAKDQNEPDIATMQKMRGDGISYAKIGEKFERSAGC